jgi:hypothetical protein
MDARIKLHYANKSPFDEWLSARERDDRVAPLHSIIDEAARTHPVHPHLDHSHEDAESASGGEVLEADEEPSIEVYVTRYRPGVPARLRDNEYMRGKPGEPETTAWFQFRGEVEPDVIKATVRAVLRGM